MSSEKIAVIGHRFSNLNEETQVFAGTRYTLLDLGGLGKETVYREAVDAAGVLVGSNFTIDKAFIEGLRRCRGIVRYGIGMDNVDQDSAQQKSIEVANVPDYCVEEVSNHAVAMLLAFHRRLFACNELARNGQWGLGVEEREIPRLSGTTLGLIGMGRIGHEVARKVRFLGVQVIVYDPYLSSVDANEVGVRLTDIDTLAAQSDFISLHAPLTLETRHIVSRQLLQKMKPGCCIINVSRGALIHQKELAEALVNKQIAGAALDVFEDEPLPIDDPILNAPNVIMSPHVAWLSVGARKELQRKAAKRLLQILEK